MNTHTCLCLKCFVVNWFQRAESKKKATTLRVFLLCLILCVLVPVLAQTDMHPLSFKQITTLNGLPSDEVQKVYQDHDDFMWFATRYGFCKYDGYQTTIFRSGLGTPDLLTNNSALCLAHDRHHNLWIGTMQGLNVYNKEVGEMRKTNYPGIGNITVSTLLVTREGVLWVGTDTGLFRYHPETDEMELCGGKRTDNVLSSSVSIKTLYEDSDGDLWIGTWNSGLYRYSILEDSFFQYPKVNSRNSAHVIFEDSYRNIWVGGWDEGLFLIRNPKDMKHVSYVNYRCNPNNLSTLSDNLVYDINEDIHTNTLWVGTRSGLSIMSISKPGVFVNYKTGGSPYQISCNEINSICRDASGKMWLGTIGGGVYLTDTRRPEFQFYGFDMFDEGIPTPSVRALYVDDDETIWMGVGTYGLARYDRNSEKYTYYSRIQEFSEVRSMPTVYTILKETGTGALWFGTYDGGIYIYKKGEKVRLLTSQNTDFIKNDCVTALYEDTRGNYWVGTRYGLGVKRADGTGYLFPDAIVDGISMSSFYVVDIEEDENGSIWLATNNNGVVRITGNINNPPSLKYALYYPMNGKISAQSVKVLMRDSENRLWAGTEGYGLQLYDSSSDSFIEKNALYQLPCDYISSIEEDRSGTLWMGTNGGLVRLKIEGVDNEPLLKRVYTAADGLQDNFFISKSSFNYHNTLFFGGYKGLNSFNPENLSDGVSSFSFYITDVKLHNRSLNSFDREFRQRISSKTPSFTNKIVLPYRYNNFNIEFASLTYKNPEFNKYAFQLKGFDKGWQYTDATRHFANYNNLNSGTYTFLLRASNENGIWSEQTRELTVVILPPLWATWWAYLCYLSIAVAVIYYLYRMAKKRMELRNSLMLQRLEQSKSTELNHAKLQFFTNITHELLTPLTIISATVDELKSHAPEFSGLYPVIDSNIQRLIRLLQQILEFRKAETGNLKLRVSQGDIAAFIRKESEAFMPLMKKRKLHFSVVCDPEVIRGYFDTDKIDKVLYNLISNAAKYCDEGGYIQLDLSYAANNDFIIIAIKDNGKGIAPERQKELFKRFYEGDYRKFNTIGSGIGLSLTKDLVTLCGGTIRVESEQGKGTSFFVQLPIERSYFKEEEIDDERLVLSDNLSLSVTETPLLEEENAADEKNNKSHTILVIEDNEELLHLMVSLLGRDYHILTAENGKEAVVIIENEDVDLIVSDVMMPEMNGIELCRFVKNTLEYSHIPIILLTAKNKEEDRAEAYESGADAFISKPFNLAVLHARIRNLLKNKQRVAQDFKNQLVFEIKDLNYTSIDEEFLQSAFECVNRHLDDPEFDQQQFIDEMATSKSTLYKKLKSLTGLNTSAFIRNIRMKAAIKIMEEKRGIRVSELAYAIGFNDPKYFSSCFKKEFGMLPTEYVDKYFSHKEEN